MAAAFERPPPDIKGGVLSPLLSSFGCYSLLADSLLFNTGGYFIPPFFVFAYSCFTINGFF